MRFRKRLLHTTLAALLGTASSAALATTALPGVSIPSSTYTYAIETVGTNAVYQAFTNSSVDLITTPVSINGDFLVKFTLNSGTFNAQMQANFLNPAGCLNNSGVTLIAGGTTADNFVTYRINKGAAVSAVCSAGSSVQVVWDQAQVGGGFRVKNPTALATVGGRLQMTTQVTDTSHTAIFLVGTSNLSNTSIAGTTFTLGSGAENTVDVTYTSQKFTGGATTVALGTVTFGTVAARSLATNANLAYTANDVLTVTLTGDFSAAAASNAVFYDTDNSGAYNTGDILGTISGNTATLKLPMNITSGRPIRYTVSGSAVIPAPTTYTASGAVTWSVSTYVPQTLPSNNTYNLFTKNGATTYSQLVNPSVEEASQGYVSIVRLTNSGSVDGAITATLTLDDGTSGSCTLPIAGATDNKLAVGKSVIVLTRDIETCTGKPIPSGQKGRLRFDALTTKLVTQSWNLNTANKTLTNQGATDPGSAN